MPTDRPVPLISLLVLFCGSFAASPSVPATKEELQQWSSNVLEVTLEELSRTFNYSIRSSVPLRIYTRSEFEAEIGPASTLNAIFHQQEIAIVMRERVHLPTLRRTIRHEAVHAAVAELSNSSCPAWLEEGLAQLFEGLPPARLSAALRLHVKTGKTFSLTTLQDSFALAGEQQQAVAYALSRFAVRR